MDPEMGMSVIATDFLSKCHAQSTIPRTLLELYTSTSFNALATLPSLRYLARSCHLASGAMVARKAAMSRFRFSANVMETSVLWSYFASCAGDILERFESRLTFIWTR